jgi:hypothetical protein
MTAFVWLIDLYMRSPEAQAETPEEEEIRFCSFQIPLQSVAVLVFGIRTAYVFRFRLGFEFLTDRVAPWATTSAKATLRGKYCRRHYTICEALC